jgi:hypothetical protein
MEWTSRARRISSAAHWGDAIRTWLPENKYRKVVQYLGIRRCVAGTKSVTLVRLDGRWPTLASDSQCHRALRSRSIPPPYFLHSLALQEGHDHKTLTNFSKSLPVRCFCLIGPPHLPHFSDSGTVTAFMPVFTGADLYLCAMKFRNDEIVES